MIIKKVKLRNIRSYEDAEISFPEGSTVLAGDIGTGKTSVLLAIEFALFGLQPGQKGSSLLRNGKDEGFVQLEIEIDNRNIVIERGLKRGKTVNQSYAKISIDKEEKETSITELKNKVLELLNYPKEFAKKTNILYRFTVYTPQEEMRQIILESAEVRLNTLRHIFGIDKYKRVRENTQLFTSKLREQIRNYEGQIKDLEELRKKKEEKGNNLKNTEEKIERLKAELEEKQVDVKKAEEEVKEIEEKIEEKENYEKEIEKTTIMLASKKELIRGINREKTSLTEQIEQSKKIKFEISDLEKAKKEKQGKESEEEIEEKSYLEILSKINATQSKISEDKKLKEGISILRLCPTCLQAVTEIYKENIFKKIDDSMISKQKELEKLNQLKEKEAKEIEKLKNNIKDLDKKINELNLLKIKTENIKEKESRLEEIEKQEAFIQEDISLLEKQILTLKQSCSLLKKYENLYELKEKNLIGIQQKEREKEIELASCKREKEMTIEIIFEIEKEIGKKEETKKKLLNLSELEDWLSSSFLNIISFTERNIMFKLKENFSKLFNEWFNILVPEIFSVRLDEDFTPVIEQQDYQLDYSFLSGGERTAVALAYRLALNQVLNSLLSRIKTKDLVILDEPTDGFSEQQLDKIRDVLQELKVQQLIIVSHESKIESFVENIIKFKKEQGITKVEA